MAMAQHVLSDGKTYYNDFMGAFLITLTLYLLHWAIVRFISFNHECYALSYFPSLLILAVITDISPNIDHGFSFGSWLWVFPLLILIWGIIVWLFKGVFALESPKTAIGWFSRFSWLNLLYMCVMFVVVGITANSDEVFHYRMSVERSLVNRDYQTALTIGSNSLHTDSSLTMLRIYALAATNNLPNHLFEYPLVGGSKAMKPNGTSVKMMLYTDTKLKYVRKSKKDYILCAYLLDHKIDAFAHEITKWYDISKPLPKHYREALTLYSHIRSNAIVSYHDNVLDADYRDYYDMKHSCANKQERQNMLHDTYGKTYWYYYDYQ